LIPLRQIADQKEKRRHLNERLLKQSEIRKSKKMVEEEPLMEATEKPVENQHIYLGTKKRKSRKETDLG
jgi:hypothetical protein